MKMLLLLVAAVLLWLPYYVWGVGLGNRLLAQNRMLPAGAIITATVLLGFIGLHLLQRHLMPDTLAASANFRLLLILSTQLTAVVLIAIDSAFNWKAIAAGLLVMAGAAVAVRAIE